MLYLRLRGMLCYLVITREQYGIYGIYGISPSPGACSSCCCGGRPNPIPCLSLTLALALTLALTRCMLCLLLWGEA